MIYKLAPHIHMHAHNDNLENSHLKEVLDIFSDYDIISLVVHSSDVDKNSYSSFVKECEKLSNTNKLILPCLEDENSLYHLLLVGAESYTQNVFNPNREYLIILAHPWGYGYHFRKIKKEKLNLKELDGIEAWNLFHNSRKFPSLKTMKFFKNTPKEIKAYIGLDEHPPLRKQDAAIFVDCENLKKESVLKALKEGRFFNKVQNFIITSQGELKKDKKTINKYIEIRSLTNEWFIHQLSLLVYIGNKVLDPLNMKNSLKHRIIRPIKWLRRYL